MSQVIMALSKTIQQTPGFSFTPADIVALIIGLLGGIGGIVSAIVSGRKQELDSLRATMNTLTEENQRLVKRQKELEDKLTAAIEQADKLEAMVRELKRTVVALQQKATYLESENADYKEMLKQHGLTEEDIARGGQNTSTKEHCACKEGEDVAI